MTAGRSNPPPVPFRNAREVASLVDADSVPPALVINPDATLESLLAAIQARVGALDQSLNMWSCAKLDITNTDEVAYSLRPFAQEADDLLEHAMTLVRKSRGQS